MRFEFTHCTYVGEIVTLIWRFVKNMFELGIGLVILLRNKCHINSPNTKMDDCSFASFLLGMVSM
jgi:hypothetical protein